MFRIVVVFLGLFSSNLLAQAFFVPKCPAATKPRSSSVRSIRYSIPPLSSSPGKSTNSENDGAENASDKDAIEGGTTHDTLPPSSTSKSIPFILPGERNSKSRRKMELSWCTKDSCLPSYQNSREKVVGEDNDIEFNSPATGQVVYNWADRVSKKDDEHDSDILPLTLPRVLLLVKRNDDELMKEAADAVRELTAQGGLKVMLQAELAAKLKHYFGVDDEKIELYEIKSEPGFGGNHLPTSDPLYNTHTFHDVMDEDSDKSYSPDLVCTLGGDGLLLYASTLFSGPCPPILCVSGGSLGFLTPFSRDEMVNAIRASLGLVLPTEEYETNEQGEGRVRQDDSRTDIKLASMEKNEHSVFTPNGNIKFQLGINNQICVSLRMRLECQVTNREGMVRARFNVLNEVVIDRGNSPYLAALECFCDDVHLTTVQADGIIFSTPTGSTAYGMSAGGPVAHPAVPAILVTPICPHVLSFRSMVFPDHVVLRCFVPEDARADAAVAFDGKYRRELHRGDSVEIKMSPYPVPTINRMDHSADWLSSLKRNFNFNTRVRQAPL